MGKKNKDGIKYITPKKADLERRFKEYNEMYFDGALPPCKMMVSETIFGGFCSSAYNFIKISNKDCWTEESLKLFIIHEMVHYYVHKVLNKNPIFAHGWTFNRVCDMLRKKYNLKVKFYELPYVRTKGEKEPTILKRLLFKILSFLIPF